MNRPIEEIESILSTFRKPDRACYPELDEYSDDDCYVECCYELQDTDAIYEELVRYEHENNIDPFDVQICLDQIEWAKTHQPRKSLFVLTARKK